MAIAISDAAAAEAESSSVALPGDAVYPESVTATSDGTFYVSSFASGGVIRVRPGEAQGEIWIKPGAFGTRSTFGVLADERSNTLWVCSNDLSALGVPGPSDVPGSALKAFDLKSGEGRLSIPLPTPALCNDIALAPDGTGYVTNTAAPQILRLKPGDHAFEVFATDPRFGPNGKGAGLDGIAFGQDGDLYVNTFSKAELFRVEVKDGAAGRITQLTPSRALKMADGLRPAGDGSFLMAEGGGSLDRVTIVGDAAKIETLHDGIAGGATGVAKVGDTAWVTEGQLAYLLDPSKKGGTPPLPFRIFPVRLK
ncbi:SMP-30/gluconolactonase/LRE family protein [Methylobacterium planeticum]|uniref:SMP-30/gluconolactonase/LRE family protein n=1 Tax=Methylobacterium planeticum TaxID=2615211 RepID=UPI001FEF0FA7|nr:hypothetical protein [Methylobacterium planeticum]